MDGLVISPNELTAATQTNAQWQCEAQNDEPAGGDWSLRFEVDPSADKPRILYTRLGYFDALTLSVLDQSGNWTQKTLQLEDMRSSMGEPFIYVDLPRTNGQIQTVIASFAANGHGPTLTLAQLRNELPGFDASLIVTLIAIAALIGILIVPLVLNTAFFLVLRESFLAWHIALSLSFAMLLIFRAGMFGFIIEINAYWWRIGMVMSMGATIAAALMFTRSFIEPGKLSGILVKCMPIGAIWALVVSAIHAASFEVLRPLGGIFHSVGMVIPLGLMLAALMDASLRRSRAVRFQVLGWLPLIVGSGIQIVTYVFPIGLQIDVLNIFYFGILSEGLGTVMGVADRFFILKRQRDAALTEARTLEKLSEHDPLTGLMNRRLINNRFKSLHSSGFDTFALIDLDYFKKVNDSAGHATGDAVLMIVADLLMESPDTVAIRLGGEEFFLLLKGEDAAERVENIRRAIPIRISNEVPELEQLVTASMGVIIASKQSLPKASFTDIYRRTDTLLYEAKELGRNRAVTEKINVFDNHKKSPSASKRRSRSRKAAA